MRKKEEKIKQMPSEGSEQDGFDFIEYPCNFNFKAMCKLNAEQDEPAVVSALSELVANTLPGKKVMNVQTKQSRTGKFVSVSLLVPLESRAQLEAMYQAIAQAPMVVMTL